MTQSQVIIEQVTNITPVLANRVRELAQMLGHNYKKLTNKDLRNMISSHGTFLFVARDKATNAIMGMVTVVVHRTPYVKKALLEDLVVDEAYRGRGLGKLLIKKAVTFAQKKNVAYMDCTARLRRTASNQLYEKVGFQKRETNVYRLLFDYAEV